MNITVDIYPAIKEIADYERVQAAIASITNLIAQEAFSEAENATTDAQILVNDSVPVGGAKPRGRGRGKDERADRNRAERKSSSNVRKSSTPIGMRPKQLQEASSHLQRAKQELDTNRYERAQQSAQQAQQSADEAVATAEAKEYRQRAQQALNALVAPRTTRC